MLSPFKNVNRWVIFILIIFFSISAGCGSGDQNDSNKGAFGIIQGKVTASSNISFKLSKIAFQETLSGTVGISGAVCTLEGTGKSATTDEDGSFQISDVIPGSYIVICKKTALDGKVYAFLNIAEVRPGETTSLGTIEITQTGNIQGTSILEDKTDYTGITIYIPGTSMQARTDAAGAYLINNVPVGSYDIRFEKVGYKTAILTNIVVASEGETILIDIVTLDLSTGATGGITIEDGKVYSNSRTVAVSIDASDDAVLYQISEDANFVGAVWNHIPPSRNWIFNSDGEKRLYIKFADANGLESSPESDSIIIDTTPPANGSMVINNGLPATNSSSVTLTLSATDATTIVSQMMISNGPDFTDANWESFTNKRSWTVSAGDDTKTVYVKFRDLVGNETKAISASIVLDTKMPVLPSVSIQEGEYTNNSTIHLSLSASDATLMKISEDTGFAGVSAIPFALDATWSLSNGDGSKTIYVVYLDDAGNETEPVSASVILDTISPTTPVIFNQNQTTNQATFEMTLSADSTDTNFTNYQLKGGQYQDWTDTSETSAFSFTLTQQGYNILSIRGKDRVGSIGNAAYVTITLDTDGPIISYIDAGPAVTYATIIWRTNEHTTSSKVEFGLNEDYGTIVEDTNFTTNHTIQLSGLASQTLYHYRIISVDRAGNMNISTDLMFTTIKVKAITMSGGHTCVLTTTGGVKCWGNNFRGQLGDDTISFQSTPIDVIGMSSGVASIATGAEHTCIVTTTGSVKCWGNIIGTTLMDYRVTTPIDMKGLSSGVVSVTAGDLHSCALMVSGGVKCWGKNIAGQIGTGSTSDYVYEPVEVTGLSSGVASIAIGAYHTCVVTTTGGVKCWGSNAYGQLGDGTTNFKSTPVDVTGLSSGVASITATGDRTCALTTTGGVKCWGVNYLGQLGDGTTTSRYTPVDVTGLSSGVASITESGCALTTTGGVKCWGDNSHGQLGDGTTTYQYTPVDVTGLSSGVASITEKGLHTCALTTSGGVKCWGDNSYGQLGDGTTTSRYTPVDVTGLSSGVAFVAIGGRDTCALTTTGGVKCWGDWREYGLNYGLIPTGILGLH